MKESLFDYDLEKMQNLMNELNEPIYRATQIFDAIYKGKKIDDILNLSISLREKLKERFLNFPLEIEKCLESKDGTKKYLLKLSDGEYIESVLMSYKYGKTLCISTQVGCKMKCAFCASGLNGLKRNLTAAEMLAQIVIINAEFASKKKERAITNIVLMGSGEPFDNFSNLVRFLKLVSSEFGLNISQRNISVSTSGLPDKIKEVAELGFHFNLTLSLHAATDNKRDEIMPVNKAYNIQSVLNACDYYFKKTRRRLIFEYIMIENFNATIEDAKNLIKLLKDKNCHLNLIRLNNIKKGRFLPSKIENIKTFLKILTEAGISVTLRRTLGNDIEGACGQLRRKFVMAKDD